MTVEAEIIVIGSVIFITLVLSKIIRSTLAQIVKPGLVLDCLLEAVAAFELCAVSFEQGLYFENFGKLGFATSLFFVCLWRSYHWSNVATAPHAHLEKWLRGNIPIVTVLFFVLSELLAGSIVYRYYTKPIWSLELSATHVRKTHSTSQCKTLVQVDYIMAALVECGVTFLCGMLIRVLYTVRPLSDMTHVLKAAIITSCVMLGFDYSGGHMNPVLATIKQYGCSGITIFQHVFVYWIGASVGGLLAYFVWKMFSSAEQKVKVKAS